MAKKLKGAYDMADAKMRQPKQKATANKRTLSKMKKAAKTNPYMKKGK